MRMEEMSVALEPELLRRLHQLAEEEGRAESELLHEALVAYLRARGRTVFLSRGIGEDDEVTGENSEDWLRAHWNPR
jgi:predicted transcriptional regulator